MILCAVGAGGKTTAVTALALSCPGVPVLLTTTTHMRADMPAGCRRALYNPSAQELVSSLCVPGAVFAGTKAEGTKVSSLPDDVLKAGMHAASHTFIEADGAHCLPLKLHAPWEPVIPEETDFCLILCGTASVGKPVCEGVHRWQLCPEWAEHPDTIIDARVILRCAEEASGVCRLPVSRQMILISQMETAAQYAAAEEAQEALLKQGLPCRLWPHNTAIPFSAES